jgi:hypothetical protein
MYGIENARDPRDKFDPKVAMRKNGVPSFVTVDAPSIA